MSRFGTLKLAWPLLACLPAAALSATVKIDFETGAEGRITPSSYSPEGVSFANAYLLIDDDSPGRLGQGPVGSGNFGLAPSKFGAMTLVRPASSSAGATLTFAQGFTGEISFWYSTIFAPATVQVLDAAGNVIARSGAEGPALLALGSGTAPFRGPFSDHEFGAYNRWQQYTLSFSGVGTSLVFNGNSLNPGPTGMALGDFFIDDIVVTTVPEAPAAAMLLAGLGALGAWRRRRRP